MNLSQALRLDTSARETIRTALVGAGGKTTAMFRLARELTPPVLVTASTHLGAWQISLADQHLTIDERNAVLDMGDPQGVTLLTGEQAEDRRVKGLDLFDLMRVKELADQHHCPLILEADGSRQRPLKAPAEHEPVIPEWTRQVIIVAGLSGLGQAIDPEWVHRPERFARLANQPLGSEITEKSMVRVLLDPEGGLARIPPGAQKTVLLTQADHQGLVDAGLRLARSLVQGEPQGSFYRAVISSLTGSDPVSYVVEPTAGVVLAAGSASRFGSPKILLEWRGRPLIRKVVETALAGGLHPISVVLGAVTDLAVQALEGLPVQFVFNSAWTAGQSTSLKAGVQSLMDKEVGSAVFLLADQPFVSPEIIQALCLEHSRTLAPVVAPQVNGRRANPVLFDQAAFSDLLSIEGDVGGRALFQKYPPQYVAWQDERLLIDLDTPQDYENLIRMDDV